MHRVVVLLRDAELDLQIASALNAAAARTHHSTIVTVVLAPSSVVLVGQELTGVKGDAEHSPAVILEEEARRPERSAYLLLCFCDRRGNARNDLLGTASDDVATDTETQQIPHIRRDRHDCEMEHRSQHEVVQDDVREHQH